MLIGSLALAGVPFLSGFYSKDAILELAYVNFDMIFGYWFGVIAAFYTAYYSMRLLYYTFYTRTNGYRIIMTNVMEGSNIVIVTLTILLIGSIFIGYLTREVFIGLGSDYWGNAICILPNHVYFLDSEFLSVGIKLIPVILSVIGGIISYLIYVYFSKETVKVLYTNQRLRIMYIFLNKKWFFDILYASLARVLLNLGYVVTFKFIDRGIIEWIGPYGLVKIVFKISQRINRLSTGYLYHYFIFINIACMIILGGLFMGVKILEIIFIIILLLSLK